MTNPRFPILFTIFSRMAAFAALALIPMSAQAADKTINKDQQAQGLKEAPAVVRSSGVPCTVTDAYFIGKSNQRVGYQASYYEAACKEGMGYVVVSAPAGSKADAIDCLAAAVGEPKFACRLPANADPRQGLVPLLATARQPCTLTDARYIGRNLGFGRVYETACKEGEGYVLVVATRGPPAAIPCLREDDECRLTSRAQSVASFSTAVAQSGRACQLSDVRYVGTPKDTGESWYEIVCASQPGFMMQTDSKDRFERAVNCSQAGGIEGGCVINDKADAIARENAAYSKLVKAGGFDCDVSKRRVIDVRNQAEVVEFACANRPDGAVAIFPEQRGAKPEIVVDCVRSGEFGATCKLTRPTAIYPKYSAALAGRCKVSDARWVSHSPTQTDVVELACADGSPGWVIELTPTDEVKTLQSCSQAKTSGLTCRLPTNAR